MSFTNDLMWSSASGDHEHEQRTASLVHGKVAVASYWPFLSSAVSEGDFETRLDLVLDKIASLVPAEVLDEVVSSLRDDYRLVAEASEKEAAAFNAAHPTPFVQITDKGDGAYLVHHVASHSWADQIHAGKDKDEAYQVASDFAKHAHLPTYVNDKLMDETIKPTATAYVPDPNKDWRYSYDVDTFNPPVNNGALQDEDGFVKDLAEGEGRSNWKIDQETTPGTWDLGKGMPERPMPFSEQQGYKPVAVRFDKEGYLIESSEHNLSAEEFTFQPEVASGDWNAISEGTDGHYVEPNQPKKKTSTVEAPVPANPFYFDEANQGLGGPNEFSVQPQGDAPIVGRQNGYGDVAPEVSHGSAEGTVDGDGYSRATPGESPDFNRTAANELPGDDAEVMRHYNRGNYDGQNRRKPDVPEHPVHGNAYRVGWEDGYNGLALTGKTAGGTDGKIVGLCKNCNRALRSHATPHGSELHHLHSDSPRCNDKAKTATSHGGAERADYEPTTYQPRHETHDLVNIKGYPEWSRHEVLTRRNDISTVTPAGRGRGDAFDVETHRLQPVTANKYIKKDGDDWVITQKGTGKVLSRHDSEEKAEASFRAMMESKHGQFFDPHDASVHVIATDEPEADPDDAPDQVTDMNGPAGMATTADYVGRPDASNPTGLGPDEYKARTWNAFETTRPMQSQEDRNVNTPTMPQEPVKTIDTDSRGSQLDVTRREDEED